MEYLPESGYGLIAQAYKAVVQTHVYTRVRDVQLAFRFKLYGAIHPAIKITCTCKCKSSGLYPKVAQSPRGCNSSIYERPNPGMLSNDSRASRYVIMIKLNRTKPISGIEAIMQGFAERKAAGLVQPVSADYCITDTDERVVNPIHKSHLWYRALVKQVGRDQDVTEFPL